MIVGISGKKQSGKNTVALIWQLLDVWYNTKEKTNFDRMMSDIQYVEYMLEDDKISYNKSSWQQKSFAHKLKQITCILLGCKIEDFENEEFKNSKLPEEWKVWKIEYKNYNDGITHSKLSPTKEEAIFEFNRLDNRDLIVEQPYEYLPTYREVLQHIGTDLFRNQLHPNIWVNATMADYKLIESNIKKSNTFIDGRLKHGYNKTRIFRIYHNIKQRCSNPNHPRYENYGGKGITICNEWNNSIESFVNWANENGYQEGLTIDRIDNNSGYSPLNCRWVNYSTQAINQGVRKDNTSGYKGVSKDKHNWRASIQINKERKFLGYFDTAEAASEAYEEAFLERENLYDLEEQSNVLYPSWCITDVRFFNEAQAIKDRRGILIRVDRDSDSKDSHVSENDLITYKDWNYVIDNNYSLAELILKVRQIMFKEEIIYE